jgi:hypothetical protein
VSSRSRARQLFEPLPSDLRQFEVVIDFAEHSSAPPSFLDEIVKVSLLDRRAATVSFRNVHSRLASHLEDSAKRRGVQSRIIIDRRG